jgi:preprotein translocase subunit SecA
MIGEAMSHGSSHAVAPDLSGDNVPKVGRNDPCPCGSGKKYKQCHGRIA